MKLSRVSDRSGESVNFSVLNRSWRVAPAKNRIAVFLPLLFLLAALPAAGRDKNKMVYGEGLLIEVPLPISEVEPAVEEVAQSGTIHGTKEYNKDEFITGARLAESSSLFPAWKEGGKVFYKVREKVLDPRNFKDSEDEGTLAVRYIVKANGDKNTILRIDALFREDVRRVIHKSNGSVESEEYKDIRDHLDAIQVMKKQDAESNARRQEMLAKKQHPSDDLPFMVGDSSSRGPENPSGSKIPAAPSDSASSENPAPAQTASAHIPAAQALQATTQEMTPAEISPAPTATGSSVTAPTLPALPGQTVEERVKALRKQLERLVKSPGAPLKSAPFHTASTLAALSTGTEVLILVSTPYWYGVETHEGQHGWVMRDELEELP